MPIDALFRPTLLVGVGGTGGQIVEQVFLEAQRNNLELKDRIAALVFDTDENWLNELRGLDESSKVRFSTADPLHRVLSNNPEVEGDWFPQRDTLAVSLLNMNMLRGAAQIRLATRLALHDSFRTGKAVRRAEQVIARIAAADGRTRFEGAINILIVGSLAGATGSGSFFQIALMLRDACGRQITPNVMGLFLMPDVFVRTNALPKDQIGNVYANAYASLKELNALNVLALLPDREADFEYRYSPTGSILPSSGRVAFDSVTMIDFESSRGTNMGNSVPNYVNMAKRAGYLLIFSPLGAKYEGMAVNDQRAKMLADFDGDSNIYSSVGISALNYPQSSMRDWLAKRLVPNQIDGNWIKLDELFRIRARRFAELKQAGKSTGDEPDIEQTYLRDLEQLAVEEKIAFFSDIWTGLNPAVEGDAAGGDETRPLHTTYLDSLIDYVKRNFWNSEKLRPIAENCETPLSVSIFEIKKRIQTVVEQEEKSIDADLRDIKRALRSEPEAIFNAAWTLAYGGKEDDWRSDNIQSYIIKGGPHPVRTRAFLYRLKREILRRRAAPGPEGRDSRQLDLAIRQAPMVFNSKRSETADSRSEPKLRELAEQASGLNQSLLSKVIGTSSKEFAHTYKNYHIETRELMRAYGDTGITEVVLDLLLKEIDQLLRMYVGLFSEIESISGKLALQADQEAAKFDSGIATGDGNVWVYSDKSCREAAWLRVRDEAAIIPLGADVNRQLSVAIFKLYTEAQSSGRTVTFGELGRIFTESVIEGFGERIMRDRFAGAWRFSVIEATRREAAIRQQEELTLLRRQLAEGRDSGGRMDLVQDAERYWQEFLRNRVAVVSNQAEPYSTLIDSDAVGQAVKYWTLSPLIRKEIGSVELFQSLFTYGQGENPYEQPEFPAETIYCCNFRLNLRPIDMAKFHPGDRFDTNVNAMQPGLYHNAYQKMVDDLIEVELDGRDRRGRLTPHIQVGWHRPGVLPELSPQLDDENRRNAARAVVISLMMGLLVQTDDYGRRVETFSVVGRPVTVLPQVAPRVLGHNMSFAEIARQIAPRPDVIRTAEQYWALALRARDLGAQFWSDFTKPGSLVRIAEIGIDRSAPARTDELVRRLFGNWCDLLAELASAHRTDLLAVGRKDLLKETTGVIRAALFEELRLANPGIRQETVRDIERCYDQARDAFLARLK